MNTRDIFEAFKYCYYNNKNTKTPKSNSFVSSNKKYIELPAVQFICDKDYVVPNLPQSEFNSNWYKEWYDPIIFSKVYNGKSQFDICGEMLLSNLNTRQAILCMTGPQWFYGIKDGLICTNNMQFLYDEDNDALTYIVNMRSNDVRRFPSDLKWQTYVYNLMLLYLKEHGVILKSKSIIWNCSSFHIYEDDWYLLNNTNTMK